MSNDNIVTHQWTAEEKAIIEREKALLKEKRKLFFVTSIFILAIFTLTIFQVILLVKYGLFNPSLNATQIVSYVIVLFLSIVLVIGSLIPLILSIICLYSTNKYIKLVSIIYLITSILAILLNLIFVLVVILRVLSWF